MSGTSADGVDAALIVSDGEDKVEFYGGLTLPYSQDLRSRLLEASHHNVPTDELLRVEKEVTLHHAQAVKDLVDHLGETAVDVDVIGFHGHTVRHIPREDITLQIGNPWLLKEMTGYPVVFDFRRHDMALGGQGAPLVSMFHQALFAKGDLPALVLNLGGVANITWLGPNNEIIAGDTGPGCGLLDEWVQEMAGLPHDKDGELAKQGQVHQSLVDEALSTEFFQKPLPKSADRFDFDHVDVSGLSVEDGAATLCAVTVQAIAKAVALMPAPPTQVWVTGGGVHHPVMMEQFTEYFKVVKSVDEQGFNPDTLEAECFAWLAIRHLRKLPLSIPETTGCKQPALGGLLAC
ncbi:Anhydro-N-acetylmuramic acid kinase [Aeoliella mucimassa]|uniref:Anhydro-N-acetylmuramic acid kinase n=2 Tax=Aeoliella mucimassa TaxID=2527972 RepID=A0A518AS68_9BACT|nr:Anhydro-N-acetylmuramic acid kinase [Aeoliella mucimassa]